MASNAVDMAHPLLTLGPAQVVRIQVGCRTSSDAPAHEQFLLELPIAAAAGDRDQAAFDERRALAALEPLVNAGSDASRHYSLHQHRWHSTSGEGTNALAFELVLTIARTTVADHEALHDGVTGAFRNLMEVADPPEPSPISRDAAIIWARQGVATAYSAIPDALSVSAEEHHPAENSWTIRLRSAAKQDYEVVVGFVDGYAGSVRVRHEQRLEVSDSLGSE